MSVNISSLTGGAPAFVVGSLTIGRGAAVAGPAERDASAGRMAGAGVPGDFATGRGTDSTRGVDTAGGEITAGDAAGGDTTGGDTAGGDTADGDAAGGEIAGLLGAGRAAIGLLAGADAGVVVGRAGVGFA